MAQYAVAVALPRYNRDSAPIELPSEDEVSSVSFPLTPASSSSASPPIETQPSKTRMGSGSDGVESLGNLASYLPVGVLRKRNAQCYTAERRASAASVEMDMGSDWDGFPESEITTLERHGWIWTRTYVYENQSQWCYVQVYVLPDDVGRKSIARTSSPLRRALKLVMARVDRSPDAWDGRCLANAKDSVPKAVGPDASEDESLWYIFNTLQNPDPRTGDMRDPYGKRAMEELLSHPTDEDPDYLGVVGLKTTLYPYQRRSAAAMVQRETQPAQVLDPRLQVYTSPTGREYYYDKEEGSLVNEKRLYSEACGGILSETMGCGKTLICLSLILATRGHFPRIPAQYQGSGNPVRQRTASLVEMTAAAAGRFSLPWKGHFGTLSQWGMSYDRCVKACENNCGAYSIPPPQSKFRRKSVSYPRPPPQHLRLCSGTLVVVPANLVDHWESEIVRHTEGLKVLTLRNTLDPTPPADELFQYDILLFTKVRFEKEAGDVSQGQKGEDSPLMKLHWLRIIVDEGHNVAGHGQRNNMTHVLDQLQVERRWVVSGTPSTGLYGVEVSLASQETVTTDTDLPEATSTLLRGRKKTGNAISNELRDLDKLRLIVVDFLGLKPWSNSRGDDPARWSKYVKTVGEDGKRRKSPSLRATLQSLVVRHRLDVVHQEIPLPRLSNKVVHLEPTFYDKLSINLFLFGLAVNAITSERKDQDYMFHPRNRKHLSVTVNNLRQAGFWWAGSDVDISTTINVALAYLEGNKDRMTVTDIETLTEGIQIATKAANSSDRNAFVQLQELGLYVQDFPSHARAMWALVPSMADAEPLLLGVSQARMAQRFVTSNLRSYDPSEGLAGAGIKARRELTERMGHVPTSNNVLKPGSAKKDNSPTAEKIVRKSKPSGRTPKKQSFTKGLCKTLSPELPLAQTRLVGTASAKLSYLLDRVMELHKAEKIIIFYDNSNSAFWIAEGLEVLGIDFRIYAGSLRPNLKTEYLTMFRESEEIRVLLMDLRQASHGLHLANASRVFIVNPIWQPNVESQAIKRAHRIGQTRPVFVETLVLKDTLEDKILKRRKEMSDAEIQDAERDLLDDNIMSSIIQNEPFIPMTDDERKSTSGAVAFLQNPPSLFDRHKLPIPDDADTNDGNDNSILKSAIRNRCRISSDNDSHNDNNDNNNGISPTKTPRKRKQVSTTSDMFPCIQSDLALPNTNLATKATGKRRKPANTDFVGENGIVMTPTNKYPRHSKRSPSANSMIMANDSSPDAQSTTAAPPPPPPPPVFLGDIPQLVPGGGTFSNTSDSGLDNMDADPGSVFGPFD